ncbi:MAG: hypothetical protein R3A45_01870 [Bdellovibrionota bacterium]
MINFIAHSAFLTICVAGMTTFAHAEEIDLASDTIVLGESIYVPACFEANADVCSEYRIQVNLKKKMVMR